MKRIITILFFALSCHSLSAQTRVDSIEREAELQYRFERIERRAYERMDRRIERERLQLIPGKEDYVFLSGGLSFLGPSRIKVEYSRQIKEQSRWSWGTTFTYHTGDWELFGRTGRESNRVGDKWTSVSTPDIYKLSGMIFYRIPVVRNALYFRLGVGLGAGYRRNTSTSYEVVANRPPVFDGGGNEYGETIKTGSATHNKILPYIDLEAAWIVRLHRNVEMKFAPMPFLTPSDVSFSVLRVKDRQGDRGEMPWLLSPFLGFYLTIGGRF